MNIGENFFFTEKKWRGAIVDDARRTQKRTGAVKRLMENVVTALRICR